MPYYEDENRKYYFADTLKKTLTAFMSLFTNVRVAKYEADGTFINYRNVPIVFGTKQKALAGLQKDDQLDINHYLPRISIMLDGIVPNRSKAKAQEILPIYNTNVGETERTRIFGASPYDMFFTVGIMSLHMTDTFQILEQLFPYFTPFRNITIREFAFLPEFTRDIKVTLTGSSPDFQEDLDEQTRRKLIWDLKFSVETNIYKPLLIQDIIKTVKVELLDFNNDEDYSTFTYAVSGTGLD